MRQPIEIDRKVMEQIIADLESKNTYTNRNALFLAASNEYQSARGLKINPSVIYLRVKEWSTVLKTPLGKRGRQKGASPIVKPAKGAKLKDNKSLAELTRVWTQDKDAKPFLKLIPKIAGGSLKSALKAKCLDCSNFQRLEIKFCQCTDCPLHAIRPYQ